MENNFDVIVIGSGIGGLTTASLLAQTRNLKVLVLERHFKIGGFTHTFQRNDFVFDVGLHYVGDMEPGSETSKLFDLTTGGGVTWSKMPHVFEKFVYPDFTVNVPANKDEYLAELCRLFPGEKQALHNYFRDVTSICSSMRNRIMASALPGAIAALMNATNSTFRKFAGFSTAHYLDAHFKDERLKAVLTSQWGDYGLPPSVSSFIVHCMVVEHYFKGGYYPNGSSAKIATSILPLIRAKGGEVLVNHSVEEILIENGSACGVIAKDAKGERSTFRAKTIVSDAGLWSTFTSLLPTPLQRIPSGFDEHTDLSAITLYLGFNRSPADLGFRGENHWLFNGYDHDVTFAQGRELSGALGLCYLSFPSLKDPEAKTHTGQIITLASKKAFEQWGSSAWKKRGSDYEMFKQQIAQKMLSFAYSKYPELENIVEFYELSTPLTVESFTGHPRGRIYGQPLTPQVLSTRSFKADTHVPGLFITGADAMTPGIVGAFMGGVVCAARIMGTTGMPEIMSRAERFSNQSASSLLRVASLRCAP